MIDAKDVGDWLSVSVVIGSLAELLPSIAAILAIIWTGIRIYEWARVRLFGKDAATKGDFT